MHAFPARAFFANRDRLSGGQVDDGLDPTKILLSIDGMGAFDHIKRKPMLEALHNNSDLASPSIVKLFYGKGSTYVWYDDEGAPHKILQGEG